jgi:hypothetical protein
MPRFLVLLLSGVSALTVIATPAAPTTMLRRMRLGEVVAAAERIVVATVVDVRSGQDPEGAPATWVTFEVSRDLRGLPTQQLRIKQFGVTEPLADGTLLCPPDLPRYRPGDEVVIFLRRPSSRGFTSPVGFGQGVYRIDRAHGRPLVRSDLRGRGPEHLDELLARIEQLVGRGR